MARFDTFPLSKELLKALEELGFGEAFPIQEQAILPALEGKDLIGLANTGSGKTVAFSLPMLQKIDTSSKSIQGLVVCPTRELAIQVSGEMSKIAQYLPELRVVTIYGGQKIETQTRQLKQGAQIVVGTPGRIIDHLNQKNFHFDAVSMVVLDEADKMLSMGFRPDMERILRATPAQRQTMLFSATMSPDILRLTSRYLQDPQTIKVETNINHLESSIEHTFFKLDPDERTDALLYLLKKYNPNQAIVFCNTRRRVEKVNKQLSAMGLATEILHGDIRQATRGRILDDFRSGKTKIIIATDLAARGIDVADIGIVFHYDLSEDVETYVHRSGRTGRAGKSGKSFSFVTPDERQQIGKIEYGSGILFQEEKVPGKEERATEQVVEFLDALKDTIINKNLDAYKQAISKHLEEADYTIQDVAAALLAQKIESKLKAVREVPRSAHASNYSENRRSSNSSNKRSGSSSERSGSRGRSSSRSGSGSGSSRSN